ncbi:hypothetical protein [Vibrio maritimus]|uniref:hypothetical protein n=1 Tax=Vibrio maritimus TaxID=990268 RepID=UPI001F3D7ECC|nr:hypothetical protein [Vibrio maritimus]
MQYALITLEGAAFRPLVDAAEIYAFNQGIDEFQDAPPTDNDKQSLDMAIVYGVYKPQPDMQFPKSEIKRHLLEGVGHWLAHIHGLETLYLLLEDIEMFDDVTLVSHCGHCPKPHATKDIAFAALMGVPKVFEFGKTLAKTTYLRWHDMDVLTNALNRKGLYTLIAPEKRFSKALTKANWRSRIDQKRAIKYAQKWR